MAKRILFLLNRAPYGSSYALEAIESILVAGVFDQEVSVLFTGAGLYQLLSEQDGGAIGGRTVGKMLGALPGVRRDRAVRLPPVGGTPWPNRRQASACRSLGWTTPNKGA